MSDPIEFNVSLNEPVNFNLEVGNQGPKGDKGDTGSKGDPGDRGEKGDPGTTDYNQLQNKPQLDLYLKKSEANTTTADLLNKINQNTDSINDTKNSLRNYALISDVNNRVSEAKSELNGNINQSETRVNNTIEQAKTELNGKITEANNKTSALDTKFTKLTSDNKAEATQIKANLATTNSVLSTHKESVDKKFTDVNTEQTSQNSLISDILNAFSKESEKGTNLKLNSSATKVLGMTIYGNTEQDNTSGKNLLKITARTAPSQGISSTVSDDGAVTYSGTMTGSWANITDYTVFPSPLPAGKYTFSIDHPRSHRIILKYKLADNTFSEAIANLTATSTSNTFTITQPIIAGYLFITAANGSNLNDTVKAQLEIGDTATDYELYTNGLPTPRTDFSQFIKNIKSSNLSVYSRNLFNTIFGNRTLNNVEIKTYEDGSFELNGTPTIGFSLINIFNSNTYIPSGKYKLKIEHLGGSVEKVWPGAYFVHTIPIQKGEQIYQAVLKPEDLNNSSKEFLITVGETLNDYYTPFVWVPHNAATNQAFWNYKKLRLRITLAKEGEDTKFTPFETTDFSLPSGLNIYKLTDDIYDEVKLENGVAKLIKRVGKLELTGEENDIYPYRTNQAGTISFKYGVSGRRIYTQRQLIADIVCSHFNSVNEDALWGAIKNKTGVSIFAHHTEFPAYADKIVFWLSVPDQAYMKITDVASFKNWLKAEKAKGTPVTIYYEMKTPTEEEITDQAVLTQLNKLIEARTYDGLTNISVTGTNLTPEIKVKYMRKIN